MSGHIFQDVAGDAPDVTTMPHASSHAWDVARYLCKRRPPPGAGHGEFHRAFFGGTLPSYVLDAVASNIAVVRSTTVLTAIADGNLPRMGGGFPAPWQLRRVMYSRLELRADRCLDVFPSSRGQCGVWNSASKPIKPAEWVSQQPVFGHPDGWRAGRRWPTRLNRPAVSRMAIFGQRRVLCAPSGRAPSGALEFALEEWDTDGDLVPRRRRSTTPMTRLPRPNSFTGPSLPSRLSGSCGNRPVLP